MPDIKNMTQREALEAIARASRGEQQPIRVRPATLEEESAVPVINPQVEPPRIDPELAAQLLMKRRIENNINPDESQSEEDPRAKEQREIRMQYLREAAKTGKVPEYLKKL